MAKLPDSFTAHLRALEWTRSKIERLCSQGILVRRDVELVYEGLYLDCVTSFESSIEHLFIQLLIGRTAVQGVAPRAVFKSSVVARDILLGGEKKYLDWLPYDKTERRAQSYFRGGAPFTRFTSFEKKIIEEILLIRNAVAHESTHSHNRFKQFVDGLPLASREKTPAGFLRSYIDQQTTRFQFYAAEMARMITLLCS